MKNRFVEQKNTAMISHMYAYAAMLRLSEEPITALEAVITRIKSNPPPPSFGECLLDAIWTPFGRHLDAFWIWMALFYSTTSPIEDRSKVLPILDSEGEDIGYLTPCSSPPSLRW